MAGHREVLARRLKEMGHTHRSISLAMGWKSPASAGHKLTGRTDWSEGELGKMCALADMSIIDLIATSNDMPGYFTSKDAAEAAVLINRLNKNQLDAVISILNAMNYK